MRRTRNWETSVNEQRCERCQRARGKERNWWIETQGWYHDRLKGANAVANKTDTGRVICDRCWTDGRLTGQGELLDG